MAVPVALGWSGGKDSMMALQRLLQDKNYVVKYLFTTFSTAGGTARVSMHGIPMPLIKSQAEALGIPLKTVMLPENPSNQVWEQAMLNLFSELKTAGISHIAWGDIFLRDLRDYRDRLLAQAGMKGLYPIWGSDTKTLVSGFMELGYRALIVAVKDELRHLSAVELTKAVLESFPPGIDPGGENGEYHTFVFDGPAFAKPVHFVAGDIIAREYPEPQAMRFWFTELKS